MDQIIYEIKISTTRKWFSEFITSVKPFKSKNHDKIFLYTTNPSLKKGSDRDFRATCRDSITYKLLCEFIGWKGPYSSNKILQMKIYSSSLELFYLTNSHNSFQVRLSLENQIQICSIQIDFIVIFRFERVRTNHNSSNPRNSLFQTQNLAVIQGLKL